MKILEAECTAGVVKVDDLPIAEAEILTQGTKPSEGVVLLDGDAARYLTSHTDDLSDLIDALHGIVQQVVTIFTATDAVTTSPGTITAAIAALTVLDTQLVAMKENLR